MITTTIYNSSCWSASTKVNEKLVFETKYGVRLCSQCNGNRFINWTSSKCEIGFSIEDSVKADDTFDKSLNFGCNQNVFVGCEAEPTKYAIYMNSSNNQFIGCRAENNDYVIFYPEEYSNRSNYIGYNAYIGINVYSNHIAFTNVDTVRDIIINAGPSENFLKSPKANIKEVDTFVLNNSADNTIRFKPDVFQHLHPSGHLVNKVMVDNGKAYKSQGYDGTKFTDIDIYYFDSRSKKVLVPIKLAEIQRSDIREWNAYYDRGYLININNRPHYIDKQVISPILLGESGTSTNRPTFTDNDKGNIFFDTTLNKPIWWNGTAWVDATGTPV